MAKLSEVGIALILSTARIQEIPRKQDDSAENLLFSADLLFSRAQRRTDAGG